MKKTNKKILMVAGGTGGHILPALSIAENIRIIDSSCHIEFVRGSSPLEQTIYSDRSFPNHILTVGRLRKNVGYKERCKTILYLPFILLKAIKLVQKIKPSIVFGTGGAISGPILLAAFLLRKKTVIFEPNIIPGLSNRWLSIFVNHAIIVFDDTKKNIKKGKVFSFPTRYAIPKISLKNNPSTPLQILILGGSQGSSIINQVVSELIISEWNSQQKKSLFSFIHQTGDKEFKHFSSKYQNIENVKSFSFLYNIENCYEWADVIISRAGTGTIAEISAAGRASILVPLSSSADQHQLENAKSLKKRSATILIEEKDLNHLSLRNTLIDLVKKPQKINELSQAIHDLKLGDRPDKLSSFLLKLMD